MVAVALSALLAVLAGAAVASAAEPRGDDDGDGIQNRFDPFAVDARNGLDRAPAVSLSFGGPAGGINGYGFTGLMTNGIEAYTSQFDPANAVVEGGRLSIKSVPQEDAVNNNQKYGFQLGINANPAQTGCFTVHGRVARPFDGVSPQDLQSMGIFLGTGDQDNYAKVVTTGG